MALERSGGVAGATLQAEVDTATLEPGEAREWESVVKAADIPRIAASPPQPARRPDRFEYHLRLTDDAGRSHDVRLGEPQLPDGVRPLVDRLLERARRRPS